MAAKKKKTEFESVLNRKAKREYEILDSLEAGIALLGTEVKALRAGRVSLNESFVRARADGLWLERAHFGEYAHGNLHNHEPLRSRRLLVHKAEARKWLQRVKEKGLTIVPLRMYFHGRYAKVEIVLGKGRKLHDKRQVIKEREAQREMRRHGKRG